MSKKSPQLRFEGFTDDWEERKLGDIFVYKQGQQVPVENQFTKRGKNRHRFIRIVDLTTNNEAPRYIEYSGDNIISSTDLFMIRYGQPGVIGYGYEGVIANNLFKLIPKIETYNLFFKYILDSMYPKIQSLSSSTTMPAISFKSLDVLAVRYPDKKEQEKIGSFFAQLDNTIALQQRKLDLLKEQKKAYLHKMFPKNGAKVPELRFSGFADDWEDRKLGELASFSKGNGYTKNDLVEFGDPIILYGRLYTKYETVIEKVDTFVNKKDKSIISEGSEVIVPASGESSEDISRASVVGKSGIILGGDLNIIKPVNYIDSIFLALTISNGSQQKEMSKRAQGKSVVHLHNSDLKQVNILYPKLEEQQKIGSFFKQLDNTIALHQRKLDLLKEQKKGFLQKMFV